MKVWTIQPLTVVNQVIKHGIYQPDFSRSTYLEAVPRLAPLYADLLAGFNATNSCSLPGVVFAFAASEGRSLYQIDSYEALMAEVARKANAIAALWKELQRPNNVVLEVEVPDFVNPLLVDINDFQALMPPVMVLPPYTKEGLSAMANAWLSGQAPASVYPSGLVQAHLPYIKQENLLGVYPLFSLDEARGFAEQLEQQAAPAEDEFLLDESILDLPFDDETPF